jgi:signal transduction histidine kinase
MSALPSFSLAKPKIHFGLPLIKHTGVRLVLVQVLVLAGVLALVGYLGPLSEMTVARQAIEKRILGEVASLEDEFAQKGAAHLPHTIDKRSRLWRGFEYRLSGPDGVFLGGALPDFSGDLGWSTVNQNDGNTTKQYLAYSKRLPNGSVVSVGQDLSAQNQQRAALTRTLLWCGALGVILGFAVSTIFMISAWRRISALVDASRQASAGQLDVRVNIRTDRPRDDIDELAVAFNTMLGEITSLMDQVREVSTAIAHDLRTPLTRVRQRLERLERTTNASEIAEAIEQIDIELENLLRSFDAMLRLAEIENSSENSSANLIDVGEVALRVAEAYRPDIEESGRILSARIEPIFIRGDAQLISQALANLLDNALRHTPEGIPIEIGVEQRTDAVALYVADRGHGVEKHLHSAILQRFHRLDASRSKSGTGLGLAIVAAISKRHHATLCLIDAAPGLKVEIQFPYAIPISSRPILANRACIQPNSERPIDTTVGGIFPVEPMINMEQGVGN